MCGGTTEWDLIRDRREAERQEVLRRQREAEVLGLDAPVDYNDLLSAKYDPFRVAPEPIRVAQEDRLLEVAEALNHK